MNPKHWTYSRLTDFEKCPRLYAARYCSIYPEFKPAESPALQRGSQIHALMEHACKTGAKLPGALARYNPLVAELRSSWAYQEVEIPLGFDKRWQPVGWDFKGMWLRAKMDFAGVNKNWTLGCVKDWKGLALDTPLPTPDGWTTMGEVKVGDRLFDMRGTPCKVTGVSEIHHKKCFRIDFDDTSSVIADEDHRWLLGNGTIVETRELYPRDKIALAEPIKLRSKSLPIDPYVLGMWLADGKHTSGEITKPDDFIWEELERRGYQLGRRNSDGRCRVHTVLGLRGKLGDLGLLGDKHIPQRYLRASVPQRLDLLRGLMDGDGNANRIRQQAVFDTIYEKFARQVAELAASLGQRPLVSRRTAKGFGKTITSWVVSFRPKHFNPFLIPRKANILLMKPGKNYRQVESVIPVASVPTRCLEVDSPTHTFLCTRAMIPTHNTGRMYGSNADQVRLYAGMMFERFKDMEHVEVELVYLDQKTGITEEILREQWVEKREEFEDRAGTMLATRKFPANPSSYCGVCSYSASKGGPCTEGSDAGSGLQTSSKVIRVVADKAASLDSRFTRPAADEGEAAAAGVRRAEAPKRRSRKS